MYSTATKKKQTTRMKINDRYHHKLRIRCVLLIWEEIWKTKSWKNVELFWIFIWNGCILLSLLCLFKKNLKINKNKNWLNRKIILCFIRIFYHKTCITITQTRNLIKRKTSIIINGFYLLVHKHVASNITQCKYAVSKYCHKHRLNYKSRDN